MYLSHFNTFYNRQNAVKSRILSQSYSYLLFPLYRCWWFAGDVVDDAVDVVNFVDDADRNLLEDFPWEFGKVSCHAIDRSDSADGNGVVIGTAVSHNADGADTCVDGKVLPNITV